MIIWGALVGMISATASFFFLKVSEKAKIERDRELENFMDLLITFFFSVSLFSHVHAFIASSSPGFIQTLLTTIMYYAIWVVPYVSIIQWKKRDGTRRFRAWIQQMRQRRKNADRQILARAKNRAKELCAIIAGVEWSPVRDNIQQLVSQTLPDLLSYRHGLTEAIASSIEILTKGEADTSEMGRTLQVKSQKDDQWFRETLQSTEDRISETMATLLHLETDLRRAVLTRNQEELEAVRRKLTTLNASVGETSQAIRVADSEVGRTNTPVAEILSINRQAQ
ncbi:MAG: hypothetical protein UU48_C0009G0023 [Candidatus Uhrbacteria bacterium GW2011_GWF2_41_16]|uniref:Uncharacterized protein n=1 Tax=Candidatus Uhrbacteria bacterium GW2011_GWF2_41_16 TaxID=1618997 RepID=A0A0G0VDM9_9BACT|nr:MAG: hypothetical protein UU48_C0009G0023 [Candidatus Uhrbacteria bacterium GW2011_GWF2_41_16]